MSQNNVVLTIPEPGKVELVERPYPRIIPGYSLVEVEIADAARADEIFTTLMGGAVEPRREFIEAHAKEVKNLDI